MRAGPWKSVAACAALAAALASAPAQAATTTTVVYDDFGAPNYGAADYRTVDEALVAAGLTGA